MSQTYIFHDQAGSIPGVPGTFSNCMIEVDEEKGIYTVLSLPSGQHPLVIDSTLVPAVGAGEITAEGIQPIAPALETIEAQSTIQEEVPETNNNGG